MSDAVAMQLVTLATVIGAHVYTWIKDARQRKWDLEDRRMARQHTSRTAEELAEKVAGTNQSLHEAIAENTIKTEQAIDRADAAYTEANSVNQKIEQLGIDNNAMKRGHV